MVSVSLNTTWQLTFVEHELFQEYWNQAVTGEAGNKLYADED